MPLILESIYVSPTADRLLTKLPELLPLLVSKAPDIIKVSKSEEEAVMGLLSILEPYKQTGEFRLSFVDTMQQQPIDFMHYPSGALVLEYMATIH